VHNSAPNCAIKDSAPPSYNTDHCSTPFDTTKSGSAWLHREGYRKGATFSYSLELQNMKLHAKEAA
jgi:hypothetical protein